MGALFQAVGLSIGLSLGFTAAADEWACRHAKVMDKGSGAFVEGIEDLAFDAENQRLFLSAYNRRTDDLGAIYTLSLGDLGYDVLPVNSLRYDRALRPHGIDYDVKNEVLWVIDRVGIPYRPVLRGFSIDAVTLRNISSVQGAAICHANDIMASEGQVYLTNDRNSCTGFGAWVAQIFGTKNGQVKHVDDGVIKPFGPKFNFPNGIAPWKDGILVSATRGDMLHHLSYDGEMIGEFPLSFPPDNLTLGSDGAVYFTGFESLIGYAWFRSDKEDRGEAPSHVFQLNADGDVRELPLNPDHLPAGATVAYRVADWLIIGSAYDHGLGVCRIGGQK